MTRILIAALLLLSLIAPIGMPGTAAASDLEFSFHIDDRVAAEDEAYVREGLRLASDFLRDDVGVTVEGTVNVNIRSSGAPLNPGEIAEATDGYIAYFTRSRGWYRSSPAFRIEVVIHEFVHVFQTDALGGGAVDLPAWMMEGAAEYLAAEALISRGLLARDDADAYRYWAIADASLDDLAGYEAHTSFLQADPRVYGLAYLGIAALVEDLGVEPIGNFFEQVGEGDDWEDAFEAAFDVTPRAFYRAFERERRGFLEPADPPAVYDEIDPVESASPVRITELPETVTAGEQLLLLARSEPNARCIAYLWGESLDLVHETVVDSASDLFWLVTIPSDTPPQTAELSVDCGAGPVVAEIRVAP